MKTNKSKEEHYFKGKLGASGSDIEEKLYLEADSQDELCKSIISHAFRFTNEHDHFYMQLNYIADWLDPSDENDKAKMVYLKYIESLISEDYFNSVWDNYMKMFGRGKF